MEAKTVEEILKEFFKIPRRYNNRIAIAKTRFITGTMSELSKRAFVISLGYKCVQEALYEKIEEIKEIKEIKP